MFVPKEPIDNKPALVQVMAWHWTGGKPLHEPMMAQSIDAYIRHQTSIRYPLSTSTLPEASNCPQIML